MQLKQTVVENTLINLKYFDFEIRDINRRCSKSAIQTKIILLICVHNNSFRVNNSNISRFLFTEFPYRDIY